MRYEEWISNKQRPYAHRDTESKNIYHFEDTAWKNAKMEIIFKKGNKKYLKNYSSIFILSNLYNELTKVLTNMLEKTLDENQLREQAGFKSRYSTTEHIHVVNQLNEKCRDYPILYRIRRLRESLRLSANPSSTDLVSRTGGRRCVPRTTEGNLRQNLDDSLSTQRKQKINVRRGVRQGDTVSSKLFTAPLVCIFRRLTWATRGLKIHGKYLSHLCLADDIHMR